jgi:dTDP-4-dehydrorhamnose 3,5-epimerase
MQIQNLSIPDVLLVKPSLHYDNRGYFFEAYNQLNYTDHIKEPLHFVQDNQSYSRKHVLRGLHYQIQDPQGKLTRVLSGEIFAVAVDLRKQSPTFSQWVGIYLSSENKYQLWIPQGFAHGFLVRSDHAEIMYKMTNYWNKEHERCIIWNDPSLSIAWPLEREPILSDKDRLAQTFTEVEYF